MQYGKCWVLYVWCVLAYFILVRSCLYGKKSVSCVPLVALP
ncbi:hypothetical protein [Helicobacter japonicus]|nr:hypothetical protein [Helicobacter japonicus]